MLAPWKESCDKPRQHIKKQRHHFLTKVHIVKAMVFLVVMYRCESWTIKKAEHWRIDAFKLWCWRRLLRVSWTAMRSNQSVLKEITPYYSLENILMLGKIEGRRRRGWQRMRCLDDITDSMDINLGKLWETVRDRKDWHPAVPGVSKSQTWLATEQQQWGTKAQYCIYFVI